MTAAIDKSTLMELNYIRAKHIQYYNLPGLCLSARATSKQVMIWSVNAEVSFLRKLAYVPVVSRETDRPCLAYHPQGQLWRILPSI